MEEPTEEDLRRHLAAADAAYEPFAPFADWAAEPVGLGSWEEAAARLSAARQATPVERVREVLDEALRAAAVDTGAIEGLYEANRGFTLSVARNVISLDQAEVEAGIGFRRSFEAQLAGFEMALQLATGDETLTEASLRELHRVTCADESTYRVLTPLGVQERMLTLGSYKVEPNHVQLADGRFHAYAPVDRVTDEVHRLVEEMRSEAFLDAPAVVQAAFSHHALTAIHPFADGNGRVARLVASVWLLRAAAIPLWVETSDRERYLEALAAADRGERQPFLRLVTSLSLRLLRELGLILEEPPTVVELAPEEVATRQAAAYLADALELASGAARGTGLMHPAAVRPPAPEGTAIESPASTLAFNTDGLPMGRGSRAILVGIDRSADEWSRIVVHVFDEGVSGELVASHRFEVGELAPDVVSSASRRLDAVAEALAEQSRAEHGYR